MGRVSRAWSWWRNHDVAIVYVLLVVVVVAGLFRITHDRDERDQRICEGLIELNNQVLRPVIEAATPPSPAGVTLPPDERISDDTRAYLQDLLDRLDTTETRAAVRARLFDAAPRLRCTDSGDPVAVHMEGKKR